MLMYTKNMSLPYVQLVDEHSSTPAALPYLHAGGEGGSSSCKPSPSQKKRIDDRDTIPIRSVLETAIGSKDGLRVFSILLFFFFRLSSLPPCPSSQTRGVYNRFTPELLSPCLDIVPVSDQTRKNTHTTNMSGSTLML